MLLPKKKEGVTHVGKKRIIKELPQQIGGSGTKSTLKKKGHFKIIKKEKKIIDTLTI